MQRSLAYLVVDPIRHEMANNKYQLLIALEEKKNLSGFLKTWIHIEIALEFFPQYTDKIFYFIINNSSRFLQNIGNVRDAVKFFPQYAEGLFEFVFKHSNRLLNNWFLIETTSKIFPQYIDAIRHFVFENPNKFLNNLFMIKTAIKVFPESANILQKQAIESNGSGSLEKTQAIIKKVHAELKGELSYYEIRKNARLVAQGSRDEGEGKKFMFFKNLPDSIGIEIAALTGTSGIHTKGQTEQIAEANYSRPSVGKKNG
jgi:hypothetical protein